MTASQRWEPETTDVKIGDAVKRFITLKAANVSGMAFPPIRHLEIDGVGIYPGEPVVKDVSERGSLSGIRIETLVYVFEREGKTSLPEFAISWFDIKKKQINREIFAARAFDVLPNPAFNFSKKNDEQKTGISMVQILSWGIVIPIVVAVGGWLIFLVLNRITECFRKQRAHVEDSEPFLFRKIVSAARTNGKREIIRRSVTWLSHLGSVIQPHTLTEFARAIRGRRFSMFSGRSSIRVVWER